MQPDLNQFPTDRPYVLTNARLATGGLRKADLLIEGGKVRQIEPAIAGDHRRIDLDGNMIWPCFVDMHTHLDKGHIWPRKANPDGTFDGAIQAVMADREANWSADDVRRRMDFSLRCAYAHGTRLIRTHLDSSPPQHRISWELFREIRDAWAGRIELQAASIVGIERALEPAYLEELCAIVAEAGGLLGMVTYPFPDLPDALDACFRAAQTHGLDLDFHVDETDDPQADALRQFADAALRHGFGGKMTAGHCCSLALQDTDTAARTMDLVAEAGIAVVSLPMCNMYLQDRSAGRTPRWRGTAPLQELKAHGVTVAVASDNTRDPFYAYGDMDMLEVYREATRILHLDHPVDDWPATVTEWPADIVGRSDLGRIAEGGPADLVICNARSWTELLSRPQADRIVLRDGAPIDRTLPDYRELDDIVGGTDE